MPGICLWSYFGMCLSCRQHEEVAAWPSLHPKPPSQMEGKVVHAPAHFTASRPVPLLWPGGLFTPWTTSLREGRQARARPDVKWTLLIKRSSKERAIFRDQYLRYHQSWWDIVEATSLRRQVRFSSSVVQLNLLPTFFHTRVLGRSSQRLDNSIPWSSLDHTWVTFYQEDPRSSSPPNPLDIWLCGEHRSFRKPSLIGGGTKTTLAETWHTPKEQLNSHPVDLRHPGTDVASPERNPLEMRKCPRSWILDFIVFLFIGTCPVMSRSGH